MADTSHEYGTILGPDANFKGDLNFESAAKVLGKFEGSITSKGKVLLADGSQCKATIAAKEVAVEGIVEGNIEATDRIDLKPTGRIIGDIVATRMMMSEGSMINGHCRIGVDGKAGNRPAATAESKPVDNKAQQQQAKGQPVRA